MEDQENEWEERYAQLKNKTKGWVAECEEREHKDETT
jgi:hypothetical protein